MSTPSDVFSSNILRTLFLSLRVALLEDLPALKFWLK